MSRFSQIRKWYGRRWPVVVGVIAARRIWGIKSKVVITWLRLITKGSKGAGIVIGPRVSVSPGCHLELGDNLFIGSQCNFEISANPAARVTVGSNTWISHDCHICSYDEIQIGADVLIGEFVSLRDTSHSYQDTSVPIRSQPDVRGRIAIEDDVWIGRGSVILGKPGGVCIGRGAIIGANSVVSESIPAMEIWGGVPARFIKCRQLGEPGEIRDYELKDYPELAAQRHANSE